MPTFENNRKLGQADHPVLPLLTTRYSPYVFEPRSVEPEKLRSCLEAWRWAPSSYNEQPWSLLLAEREDDAEFSRLLSCLLDANQGWAKNAGVLMISVASEKFSRNGKPNRVCEHDIGLAAANLTVQATHLGLHVHQMAGIDPQKVRHTYKLPEDHHAMTGIAIGYAGDPGKADDQILAERDKTPREREKLDAFVFHGQWGQAAAVVK